VFHLETMDLPFPQCLISDPWRNGHLDISLYSCKLGLSCILHRKYEVSTKYLSPVSSICKLESFVDGSKLFISFLIADTNRARRNMKQNSLELRKGVVKTNF
jgi:hypothetical protein